MGIKHNILLDKSCYFTGGPVTGRFIISTKKPVFLQRIALKIKGKANVSFAKEERRLSVPSGERRTHVRRYEAREIYFNLILNILGPTGLLAGDRECFFSFNLPPNLPSSFEGRHGWIRYTIKAAVKRKETEFSFKKENKVEFKVVAHTDLNQIPLAREGKSLRIQKDFYTLLRNNGTFEMTVSLPFSGFVPGQSVPMKIEAINMSKIPVDNFLIKLVEEVTWLTSHSYRVHKKTESDLFKVKVEGVKAYDNNHHQEFEITIPPVTHGNIDACNYIKHRFYLKVEGVVHGLHINPKVIIEPIFIGTVPVHVGGIPPNLYPQQPFTVGSSHPSLNFPPHVDAQSTYPPPSGAYNTTFGSAPNLYPASSYREPPPPYSPTPSAPPNNFLDVLAYHIKNLS